MASFQLAAISTSGTEKSNVPHSSRALHYEQRPKQRPELNLIGALFCSVHTVLCGGLVEHYFEDWSGVWIWCEHVCSSKDYAEADCCRTTGGCDRMLGGWLLHDEQAQSLIFSLLIQVLRKRSNFWSLDQVSTSTADLWNLSKLC
jgi:hypothetical protein